MLAWIIHRRLRAFERRFDYDLTYARDLLATDRRAFFALAKMQSMDRYRHDVPPGPYWAARACATAAEDCGPCTQLCVTMGLADGANPAALVAAVSGPAAAAGVDDDTELALRFTRAVLARTAEADPAREEVVARFGRRGLTSLAFAITSARLYPTLKAALGYGHACQRVVVDGRAIGVGAAAAAGARA